MKLLSCAISIVMLFAMVVAGGCQTQRVDNVKNSGLLTAGLVQGDGEGMKKFVANETFAATQPTSQPASSCPGQPIPIILLADKYTKPDIPRRYVMLKIEYGMIISNIDVNNAPEYYLFCRDQKRIFKTTDINEFLAELEKIPDGSRIDMVSKCSVPFNSNFGINIDAECAEIAELSERKKFTFVESLDDDPNHATFCYCENGFTILDRYDSSVAQKRQGQ